MTVLRSLGLGLLVAWLCVEAPSFAAEDAIPESTRPAAGRIVEKIPTLRDSSQQYALYLPNGYGKPDTTWPVLFVLDPRGRAIPGIERFLPAAERHGYIVVSSYQSRSDTAASVTVDAIKALVREAEVRYRVDTRRLYLAGMSGTSHASWRLAQAMGEHVAGVIGCVGGVQEETQGPPGPASFAYYGITSRIDFNYQEMLRLERHLLASGIDHRIDLFEGRHGWSPHEHTNRALDWMELQAVKRGLAAPNDALVEAAYDQALSSLARASDPLEKFRRHRDLARDFEGLRDVGTHRQAIAELENSSELEARRALENKLARREETYYVQRLGPFLAGIHNPDRRPPTLKAATVALQLRSLLDRAANPDELPEAHSARRVLESLYTAIAFQLPGTFEARGDLERAARALEIAISIFPERAPAHWRLASVYTRRGQEDRAFDALRSATGLGNVDLERLKSDPTWEPLRARPEWQELLAQLVGG